jgi:hypothetical protein
MDKPGPAYVRVLAVLRKRENQEWLVDLARNLANNEPPRAVPPEDAGLPPEFVLDPSFYAVGLGPYEPDRLNFTDERISRDFTILLPEKSELLPV